MSPLSTANSTLLDLRLVEGRYHNEGLVEIRLLGDESWGTYCTTDDSGLLHGAGRAICRRLGFPALLATSNTGQFGRTKGPIGLQEVDCGSTLTPLDECSLELWEPRWDGCYHIHDVGVSCFTGACNFVFYQNQTTLMACIIIPSQKESAHNFCVTYLCDLNFKTKQKTTKLDRISVCFAIFGLITC